MATILIGMADLNLARSPDILTTLGLGSCVGIALYDKDRRIGGLAHIMLPLSNGQAKDGPARMKFADTAIVDLINMMGRAGASRTAIVAKLAGGAHMFGGTSNTNILKVGDRNVAASLEVLKLLKVPVIASDTGGSHGRTIELLTDTGALKIRTLGRGEKVI